MLAPGSQLASPSAEHIRPSVSSPSAGTSSSGGLPVAGRGVATPQENLWQAQHHRQRSSGGMAASTSASSPSAQLDPALPGFPLPLQPLSYAPPVGLPGRPQAAPQPPAFHSSSAQLQHHQRQLLDAGPPSLPFSLGDNLAGPSQQHGSTVTADYRQHPLSAYSLHNQPYGE